MRYLGIDYGLHMGVSVSDEKNTFAYPVCILNKKENIIEAPVPGAFFLREIKRSRRPRWPAAQMGGILESFRCL